MSHDNPSFESKIPSLSASKSHLSTTPSPSKSFPKTKTSNEQVSVFPARSIATKVLVVELDYDPSEGQKWNWEDYK